MSNHFTLYSWQDREIFIHLFGGKGVPGGGEYLSHLEAFFQSRLAHGIHISEHLWVIQKHTVLEAKSRIFLFKQQIQIYSVASCNCILECFRHSWETGDSNLDRTSCSSRNHIWMDVLRLWNRTGLWMVTVPLTWAVTNCKQGSALKAP